MNDALTEAKKAFYINEFPIGAVIVHKNTIIAKAHNLVEKSQDPTAHAELIAIKKSCKFLARKYLFGCKLYVTSEPCPMCAQAISLSKIKSIYFSIYNKKFGSLCSNLRIMTTMKNNWQVEIYHGMLEEECSSLVKKFFKNKRKKLNNGHNKICTKS